VRIFFERFVLPVLAATVITVIVLNSLKLDLKQRISLCVAVLALAYFVGHSLGRNTPAPAQPAAQDVDIPKKTGDATTIGPESPAVTGNNNKIIYEQPHAKDHKPQTKKD
jgi:hypothetical protein